MKIEEIVGTIKPLKPLAPADAQVDALQRQEKQLATTVKWHSPKPLDTFHSAV